jgi:hypothetical protein
LAETHGEFLVKAVRQVLAIARTEFRFGLRRGAPVVVTALVGLLIGAGILIGPLANLSEWTANFALTPESIQRWTSFGFTLEQHAPFIRDALGDMFVASTLLAWLLVLLALLLLPIASSGSIPADRRFGVSELLRSTPIRGSDYLAGKLLGMLATVFLVSAIMLGLFFTVTDIILFTNFHFGLSAVAGLFFLKLSLLDGLPILIFGTTIGVLVGVFFRTRMAAIFPGFLVGLASLVSWACVFRAPVQGSFIGMTDLVYYYLVQNYHSFALTLESRMGGGGVDYFGITGAPVVGIGQLALMYLAVVAFLAVLFTLARLWLQWKENF